MTDTPREPLPGFQPLYLTRRNGYVESVHYGAVAVVTADGRLFATVGDSQSSTFMRSSAKPFQAIPLLEVGGMSRYQISQEELALICASHSGTDQHLQVLSGLQAKVGVSETDLLCGTHQPFHKPSRKTLTKKGLSPTQNHHNCSGKHTGMLAMAGLLGASKEHYTEVEHPVQKCIISLLAEMAGLDEDEILIGRDGCSVPTFSTPLYNAAWAWAKLIDPSNLSPNRRAICREITEAMVSQPFYVAGPGRLDTRLMEAFPEKLISKAGAEAFQAIGIRPDAIRPGSPALGIALKISDGDQGKRARRAVTLEVLHQLGVLTEKDLEEMSDLGPIQTNHNQAGIVTGEGMPCFQLQYN
jgi:L-asparaginase II